jgi:hypothetical protein
MINNLAIVISTVLIVYLLKSYYDKNECKKINAEIPINFTIRTEEDKETLPTHFYYPKKNMLGAFEDTHMGDNYEKLEQILRKLILSKPTRKRYYGNEIFNDEMKDDIYIQYADKKRTSISVYELDENDYKFIFPKKLNF